MANITNPQAVTFCNQVARPAFDKVCQLHYYTQTMLAAFTQQGLAALIPNDNTALVVDGSAQDGRPPITGASINVLIANLTTIDALLTANSNLILNQCLSGSVNPNAGVPPL